MSARQDRLIRRQVKRALEQRGITAEELWAAKLRPRPRWCPRWAFALAGRLVLQDPPPMPDYRLLNVIIRAWRTAARRQRRRA